MKMKKINWIKWIKTIISLALLIYLVEYFGMYGVWGFITFIIIIAAIRIMTKWEQFIMAMKKIETDIFGKPLDKVYWPNKELRNTKMKFKWRKKQ
jgi:hypothetical protein